MEGLGDVKLDLRRNEEAWSLYLEAAERASARDARLMLGVTIGGLAAAAARLGEVTLSRRLWAAFEQWESERGAVLASRRTRLAERRARRRDQHGDDGHVAAHSRRGARLGTKARHRLRLTRAGRRARCIVVRTTVFHSPASGETWSETGLCSSRQEGLNAADAPGSLDARRPRPSGVGVPHRNGKPRDRRAHPAA